MAEASFDDLHDVLMGIADLLAEMNERQQKHHEELMDEVVKFESTVDEKLDRVWAAIHDTND